MSCEVDIYRTAIMYLELHGDLAVTKAREMVRTMKERGDNDGADAWLRIIVAIEALRRGPEGTLPQ